MKTYNVEIVGLITVEAESKSDAVEKVKDMFDEDDISYHDLSFSCDDEDE